MSRYIFRRKVSEDFTTLRNSCITDSKLSWEARGLLHYLLSKPGDWEVSKKDLVCQSPEAGDYVIRRILKELEGACYIYRKRIRGKDGRWRWLTYVFDVSYKGENMNEIDDEMAAILGPEILERTRKIKEEGMAETNKEQLMASASGIGEKDPVSDFPEDTKPRLREFARVSQIVPTKAKKADWIQTDREWEEMGVRVEDIARMHLYSIEQGLDVSRPGSITFAFYSIQRQANQETKETRHFRVAE